MCAEKSVVQSIEFYKNGFFGYGEKGDFSYWSMGHIIMLVLLVASVFLIYIFRRRLCDWKYDENFRFIIGALCLFFWFSYYWRLLYVGNEDSNLQTFMTKLPLELCEWNCCLTALMMFKNSRKMFGISFLITNTFGILPLITPAVITNTGPAYFRFYQYWFFHMLPFIADYYMLFARKFRLKKGDILRAFAFCEVLLTVAVCMNRLIKGANYLYIANNTDAPSIANIMPDSLLIKWIIYNIVAITFFILAYTVYKLVIILSEKKNGNNADKTFKNQT